jgi:hypothetical protein
VLIPEGQAMPYWNEFKSDVETPKNRRLLLITQPSGTPDGQAMVSTTSWWGIGVRRCGDSSLPMCQTKLRPELS